MTAEPAEDIGPLDDGYGNAPMAESPPAAIAVIRGSGNGSAAAHALAYSCQA